MKKITVILLLLIAAKTLAQAPLFVNQHPDSVVRMDSRVARMMFEPGEVLVRFKDEVSVNTFKSNGKAQTGLAVVDDILSQYNVLEAEQLIKGAQPLKSREMLRTFTGKEFERPSLHNIYLLKTDRQSHEIHGLIEALKENELVIYAEPNYIYSLVGHEAVSPVLTPADLKAMNRPGDKSNNNRQPKSTKSITPNDPFFGQQWWIGAINADQAWTFSTGDTNQVIAILDTGVDWMHPDLQNKIWRNTGEVLNGQDTDGNGFVDDIRGWDFINNDNNPMDDNSHGTHVAGIAAAEADNGIGIAGVSWGAKIMPVKVMQSSGYGTTAKIIQGINYAASNGATVINMSLGSYAQSLAMEDALANAYANCVLVAAAGNDDVCIGPGFGCAPFFPAALSFVLGVQATQPSPFSGPNPCKSGTFLSGFTNYDCDGPSYSAYPQLWNYELQVPGTTLISTIPGGNYRIYNGTSMAAPVAAASAAIYKSVFPEKSQEIMWSDMINTSADVFDLQATINGFNIPMLGFVSHMLVDTLDGDGDGKPDAGETVELWFKIRNTGVQAGSVNLGIRLGEFEDPNVANIVNGHSFIGSMSAYATITNQLNPFIVQIDSNVVHDRNIVFEAYCYNQGATDTIYQTLILIIQNGIKLMGVMDSTLILTSDRLWLVNQSFKIGPNGTLILTPGVNIILNEPIINDGLVLSEGIEANKVLIFGPGAIRGKGITYTNHTVFSNISTFPFPFSSPFEGYKSTTEYYFDNSFFIDINSHANWINSINKLYVTNCVISNLSTGALLGNYNPFMTSFYHTTFDNISTSLDGSGRFNIEKCNINKYSGVWENSNFMSTYNNINIINNNFISISQGYILRASSNNYIDSVPYNYWGTTQSHIIDQMIYDFWNNPNLAEVIYEPKLNQPSDSTHGIVWKVLVNGADAQDEYVEPVGVGAQRFDVYFNREMDLDYPPQLTFGVRAPYTQHAVADSGYWSEDHKIWTAWKTMQIYTGDGINRIRVAGARDLEGFEIPVEDSRFEFLIDAAGSASTDFTATPGMGKVMLEWSHPQGLEDLLGYNMYRFQHITDTTFTESFLLNTTLILDTLFTDFDVLPGTRYYYYYKILRTSLVETDSSRITNCIPHTAAPGDANGDYYVNILDITTIASYMLNQNPQPFIFEAADINADGIIDILDITGVIQMLISGIKNISQGAAYHPEPAWLYLEDGLIRLRSNGQVAALQFELLCDQPEMLQLIIVVPGFEFAWSVNEKRITALLYSMSGKPLPAGLIDLLSLTGPSQAIAWGECKGSDTQIRYVKLITTGEQPYIPEAYTLEAYPNPARNVLTINYKLPVQSEVQLVLYDLYGRRLTIPADGRKPAGLHTHRLDLEALKLRSGMIFCHLQAQGTDGSHFNKTLKVVVIGD